MACFVCMRSMCKLKRLIDMELETRQIFLLISNVSHINDSDYLCKVCLSLLHAAAAFQEVCAASDVCFSRQIKKTSASTTDQLQCVEKDPLPTTFIQHSSQPKQSSAFVNVTDPDQSQLTEYENVSNFDSCPIDIVKCEPDDLQNEQQPEQKIDGPESEPYDAWEMTEPTQQTEPPKPNIICPLCRRTFKERRSLRRHYINVHKQPYPGDCKEKDGSEGPLECSHCDFKTYKKKPLTNHVKEHFAHLQKRFKCLNCGNTFSRHNDLQRHIRVVHLELKNFVCKICDRKFGQLYDLKRHTKKVHSEERNMKSRVKIEIKD